MRSELAFSLAPEIQTKHRPTNKITSKCVLGVERRQMDSAVVDEARSESGIVPAQEGGPGNYTQGGLYTQGNSVHNGTENVGMAGVTQVLESQGDHGGREQQTVQVGMTDGNHPTSLNISNVPGGVQVAVAVPSATGVNVVDGAAVDRTDDSHTAGIQVTTMAPGDYASLSTSLAQQYVLPQDQEEGDDVHAGDLDGDDKDRDDVLREQDRFLPIANVARIMKKSIPKTGKIAKDAKECVQECVSEFISFITSEASERCHQEKRKTINGEDILFAMQTLGFDNYVEPLKMYLQKYRESIKGDKTGLTTEEERTELAEDVQHYQVQASHIHPSMIPADQTPTTIYNTAYQTTMQQPLHFP